MATATTTTFDPTQAREALPTEINLFPDAGGSIYTCVDAGDLTLGLTIGDHENSAAEATVWLAPWHSAALHLWLTAAIAAEVLDTDAPDDYAPDDLEDGRKLRAAYASENHAQPITITAVDEDGAEARVCLNQDDAQALHPLLTAVLISSGILR